MENPNLHPESLLPSTDIRKRLRDVPTHAHSVLNTFQIPVSGEEEKICRERISLSNRLLVPPRSTRRKVLVQYLLTIEQMVENDYTVLCTFRTYFQSQNGGCRQPQVSVVQKVLMRSVRLIMKCA
ncbi:hypothetical protein V8E53_004507 [Lactarius tabidus]